MIEEYFDTATGVKRDLAPAMLPPNRRALKDSVEEYVWSHTPGGHSAMFKVPKYFEKPLNAVGGRRYQGIVVVAPAQCLKTFTMVECVIAENIKNIHADMLLVQTRQDTARDFSQGRLARLLRHSPGLGDLVKVDNTYDKQFKHGETLYMGWPTVAHLSGKTLRFVLMTDYDRFPANIDGEGSGWQLGFNRIKAFLSRGKCIAESSPKGYSIDPKKKLPTSHHYPPALGITGIYHQGTMEQWYWPCPECGEYFQNKATFDESYVYLPNCGEDLKESAEQLGLICPHCGSIVDINRHKAEMNENGVWLGPNQSVDNQGNITGEPLNSDIASFGLAGWAAQLQAPKQLALKYLQAKKEFEESGDDTELMTVVNTQLGTVLKSVSMNANALRDILIARAQKTQEAKMEVPEWVCFLTARIDIQAGYKKRFVVQVHGHGGGEEIVIDRFNIRTTSERLNEDNEELPIEPQAYIEDWKEIEKQVVDKVYPLASGKGYMPIKIVGIDQGGEDGVSNNAYEFYRYMKRQGKANKVLLIKGASGSKATDIYKISYPDNTKNKHRKAGAKGDVPVAMINTDKCKDIVFNNLQRDKPGQGYVHFPNWLGEWFYDELTYEERDFKGRWQKPGKGNNEAFDLFVYGEPLLRKLNASKSTFWDMPPLWAHPQDENPDIVRDKEDTEKTIAERPAPRPPRRSRRVRFRS